MKYTQKQLIIFCCITVIIWGMFSLGVKSVEPTISTDIALMQMNDTTEGHVATRGYTSIQSVLRSSLIPLGLTVILGVLMFRAPTKTQEKETQV